MSQEKKCTRCQTVQDIECFGSDRYRGDGYANICKTCKSERNEAYRQKNTTKISRYQKKYYREVRRPKRETKTGTTSR